ncbi:hypothetical protein EDD18DRAFT_64795 [Armillaria luteobubalina]|uniref:F-box domain-containing protein n=1 Tax=Armillaria luteobubalina TaxID=153913 RepID=A0AA39QCG8_9AGAR|nr:hypothetical protein EDD18DRAFT_64795 [Armillaria luteobubalina]
MSDSLPQEIIDAIIDELKDYKYDLKSCSLTCRSFVPQTRIHLFASIELSSNRRCQQFMAMRSSSPHDHLSAHIRSLTINFRRSDLTARHLLNVITNLTVHHITLEHLNWSNLTSDMQKALCTSFPQIHSISLIHTIFPDYPTVYGFLSGFPELKNLSLSDAHVLTTGDHMGHELRSVPLVGLSVVGAMSIFGLASSFSPISLTHLRSLRFTWSVLNDLGSLKSILLAARQNLKELVINQVPTYGVIDTGLVTEFPRDLRIKGLHRLQVEMWDCNVWGGSPEFDQLDAWIDIFSGAVVENQEQELGVWSSLDEVLSTATRSFNSLSVVIYGLQMAEAARFKEVIEGRLKRLKQRGMLDVRCKSFLSR